VPAYFATERSANNYPRLPVREGEGVFVWLAGFARGRPDESVIADLAGFGKSVDFPGRIIVGLLSITSGCVSGMSGEETVDQSVALTLNEAGVDGHGRFECDDVIAFVS
jgi:hypothetical protein